MRFIDAFRPSPPALPLGQERPRRPGRRQSRGTHAERLEDAPGHILHEARAGDALHDDAEEVDGLVGVGEDVVGREGGVTGREVGRDGANDCGGASADGAWKPSRSSDGSPAWCVMSIRTETGGPPGERGGWRTRARSPEPGITAVAVKELGDAQPKP